MMSTSLQFGIITPAIAGDSLDKYVNELLSCLNLNGLLEPIGKDRHHVYKMISKKLRAFAKSQRDAIYTKNYSDSYIIYDEIVFIKEHSMNYVGYPNRIEKIIQTMKFAVNRSTNSSDERLIQIKFGLLNAIAELFILDLAVFQKFSDYDKQSFIFLHNSFQRCVANALTNLTFENLQGKISLCTNKNFMGAVCFVLNNYGIVNDIDTVAQVFSGLIRNMSWIDPRMPQVRDIIVALTDTTFILTKISCFVSTKNIKCLNSVFSALWNLASHSAENKEIMCSEPNFLSLLLKIFELQDLRFVQLLKNATGIFNYLTAYIKDVPRLLTWILNANCISKLILQLHSSSPDVIHNSLFALRNLTSNVIAAQALKENFNHMHILKKLSDCLVEGISEVAKEILSNTYNFMQYIPQSSSYNQSSNQYPNYFMYHNHDACQNNRNYFGNISCHNPCTSIQNHLAHKTDEFNIKRENCQPYSNTTSDPVAYFNRLSLEQDEKRVMQKNNMEVPISDMTEVYEPFINEPYIEAGQLTPSLQCTRDGSEQDLSLMFNSSDIKSTEWPSSVPTPRSGSDDENQRGFGNFSESDLPESPSQCATHPDFKYNGEEKDNQMEKSEIVAKVVFNNESQSENKLALIENSKNISESEATLATSSGSEEEEILSSVIKEYMPKPSTSGQSNLQNNDSIDLILNDTTSKKRRNKKSSSRGLLLKKSIASVMPQPRKNSVYPNSTNFDNIQLSPNKAQDKELVKNFRELPVDVADDHLAERIVVDCAKISPCSVNLAVPQSSRTSMTSIDSQNSANFKSKKSQRSSPQLRPST